jgi:6-phosphogluconolactonase/glucosamine-6-phosphate isomerase/deaminase
MAERLDLDVYPTDGEAIEAAAERAAEHLRAAATPARLRVALSGGRSGRGLLVALAGIDDLPWERIDWLWADERCVATEPRRASRARLAAQAAPFLRHSPPPVGWTIP